MYPAEITTKSSWRAPETWPEIPETWWSYVFDGRLWQVNRASMPPARGKPEWELDYIRQFITLRAKNRFNLRASIRFDGPGVFYIQAVGRVGEPRGERLPFTEAIAAPPLPLIPPRALQVAKERPVPRELDFTPEADWLREQFEESGAQPVTPAALAGHRDLGWIAQECTCGTGNFRIHPKTCRSYPMYGLLAHIVRRLKDPPERWVCYR